jgi:hypothetical protein
MKQKWNALSWKQKHVALTAFLLVLAFIIYRNAISLTVQLSQECSALKERIDSAEQVTGQIEMLEAELRVIEKFSDEAAYVTHEQLLDNVAVYCSGHELELRDYPATLQFARDEWKVEIHKLTVAGTYIGTVQFLEHLRRSGNGRVVSVSIWSKTDNKTKIKTLYATVYVQCISKPTA